MNNQGGDLYYLDYSFASGIEDKRKEQLDFKLLVLRQEKVPVKLKYFI